MSSLLVKYSKRKALAEEIGVTERTLMRWENRPNGLPSLKVGNLVLYDRKSVLSWIASHQRQRNPRRAA